MPGRSGRRASLTIRTWELGSTEARLGALAQAVSQTALGAVVSNCKLRRLRLALARELGGREVETLSIYELELDLANCQIAFLRLTRFSILSRYTRACRMPRGLVPRVRRGKPAAGVACRAPVTRAYSLGVGEGKHPPLHACRNTRRVVGVGAPTNINKDFESSSYTPLRARLIAVGSSR